MGIFQIQDQSDRPSLLRNGRREESGSTREKSMVNQLPPNERRRLPTRSAGSFKEYMRDISAMWWFYSSIAIAIVELVLVISNTQVGLALFFRVIFGLGILGIIPGFLTTLALFPKGPLNLLERVALSIFLSVLISITVGVVLGLGPYFQPSNNIIVLATYVVLADIIASYRAYRLPGRLK